MIEKFRLYIQKKDTIKNLEFKVKQMKESIKELEKEMSDFCVEKGVTGLTVDGKKVSMTEKTIYSIIPEKYNDMVNWLKENQLLECCANRPINPASFNKLMKENNQLPVKLLKKIKQYSFRVFK